MILNYSHSNTCFADIECYTDLHGADYRGNISITQDGKQCQQWTSQTPHVHKYLPETYPYAGLGAHNFCRNPDGDSEPMPWCFTTDHAERWEFCDVGLPRSSCNKGML